MTVFERYRPLIRSGIGNLSGAGDTCLRSSAERQGTRPSDYSGFSNGYPPVVVSQGRWSSTIRRTSSCIECQVTRLLKDDRGTAPSVMAMPLQ